MNKLKCQEKLNIVKSEREHGEIKHIYYDNGDTAHLTVVGTQKSILHVHNEFNEDNNTVDTTFKVIPVLEDKSSTGRTRPWSKFKGSNEKLESIYRDLSLGPDDYYSSKADRLHDCAYFLVHDRLEDGSLRLHHMNSCRVRLCPICSWRRTLKIGSHAKKIFTYMETDGGTKDKYSYLFLTLTIPNVKAEDLTSAIDLFMSAWYRLVDRKEFNNVVKGYYRGLEITHNHNKKSPSYDTYHPHFHCVLVVNKSYNSIGEKRGYITQKKWQHMWGECIGYFVPTSFITQFEFVSDVLSKFEKNRDKKRFNYRYKNFYVTVYPYKYPTNKARVDYANSLWDKYIRSLYRPCKPRTLEVPYTIEENKEEIRRISKFTYLSKSEREQAIKKVGKGKKRVFARGVRPAEWIANHTYGNFVPSTVDMIKYANKDIDFTNTLVGKLAYRLMLQVNIKTVEPKEQNINSDNPLERTGLINAICETTKYTVKDKDYILPWDWDLSKDIVCTLDKSLDNRRLIAWGGILAKVRDKLKLDDEIDGDLIHVDEDNSLGDGFGQVFSVWHTGYQQYVIR